MEKSATQRVMKITVLLMCSLLKAATPAVAAPFVSAHGYQFAPPLGFLNRVVAGHNFTEAMPAKGDYDAFYAGSRGESFSVFVGAAPPTAKLSELLTQLPSMMQRRLLQSRLFHLIAKKPVRQNLRLRLLSRGYTTLGGQQAVAFTLHYQLGPAANTVIMRQIVVLRNHKVLSFSATAPQSLYAKRTPLFNRAFASVRWTK